MNEIHARWLSQIVDALSVRGVAGPSSVQGCTESQIAEIASDRTLPLRYREFLATMGRGAGKFFVGTDIFYPSIIGLTQDARELVSEDSSDMQFPADAIAFAMHQGYEVLFFRTTEGDDPPIYYYREGSGQFQRKYGSFTEYLNSAANDEW